MNKQKEKIKDEALKQLFKLKIKQLNEVIDTYKFRHPIAFETIWLFSYSFDKMYEDKKMLDIIHNSYNEIQTKESQEKLLEGLKEWGNKEGYSYEQIFK